jgi:hypothetical protein
MSETNTIRSQLYQLTNLEHFFYPVYCIKRLSWVFWELLHKGWEGYAERDAPRVSSGHEGLGLLV